MAESSVAAGQQILPLIDHLARISRRAADAAMADGSLRPRHVIALTLLDERGPMTQHAVGAALRLDPSNVVGLLNELEERGLISRRRDPADRRRHIVEVSATGADELTRTYAQLGLVEDELFKSLTCEQRSALHELLASAVAGLSPSHEAPGSDCLGPETDCAEPAPGQIALDRARLTPDPACLEPDRAYLEPDRACLEPDPPERASRPLYLLHLPGSRGHDYVVSAPTVGESLGALRIHPRAAPRWRAPVTSFWSPSVSSRLTVPVRSTGPSVVLSDLSFCWPNGRRVLDGLSAAFSPGRTGLIGVNGAGKSTLLALIAGRLHPSAGSVTVTGDVGYLPQTLTLDADARVASLLGIAGVLGAIDAIEAGDASQAAFDAVGDDWNAREQAQAWLSRLGLAHVGLDDPVGRLSGGETIMTALTALFLRRPAILLLDEPTNNLDRDACGRLYAAVESWPGVMLIVSHDRELLGLVDQIADLRSDHYGDSLRLYGGNLAAYQGLLEAEQAAARRAVGAAAADVRREHRDLARGQTRQARRDRQGRQLSASGSLPHAAAGARQRSAQETAGRSRDIQLARIADARARLAEAEEAVRDDDAIAISLPGTAVPAGRTVLRVRGLDRPWIPWRTPPAAVSSPANVSSRGDVEAVAETGPLGELVIQGPERIALTGPNGAGKSTLLRIIAGQLAGPEAGQPGRTRRAGGRPGPCAPGDERPEGGGCGHGASERGGPGLFVRRIGALGYLPQRLDVLDDDLTVAENVRAVAPAASVNEVRAGLARFLFRGARADAAAGTLSGGERFRAVLAALLLADPPPQFLLLDEPTNSLDLASVRQLSQALACYQGALLVASHDAPFLASIGITRWLRLSGDARLTDIDPLT